MYSQHEQQVSCNGVGVLHTKIKQVYIMQETWH